jgi:hypothetical protein
MTVRQHSSECTQNAFVTLTARGQSFNMRGRECQEDSPATSIKVWNSSVPNAAPAADKLALESSVLGMSEIAFRPAPVGLQDVSKMARHVPSHSGKPLERFVEGPRLMCIP